MGDVGTTLLFGLAANTDNLTVGTAYGVRQRGIPWEQNLLIGIVTTAVTLMALLAGRNVRAVLPAALPDWAGGILLIAMAAWGFYREQKAPGSWSDRHAPSTAGLKVKTCESFLLAGALSVNNIGFAIGEGIGGIGYSSTAASILCFSIMMLALGQAIGRNLAIVGGACTGGVLPRVEMACWR